MFLNQIVECTFLIKKNVIKKLHPGAPRCFLVSSVSICFSFKHLKKSRPWAKFGVFLSYGWGCTWKNGWNAQCKLSEASPWSYLPGQKKEITNCNSVYFAQTLLVVVFIVVNFGGFWVIARNPPDGFGQKLVQIVPTSLPELSKPPRDLLNLRKTKFFRRQNLETTRKLHDY